MGLMSDEELKISIDSYLNEWKDKKDFIFVDIREEDEITSEGGIKAAFRISMYDIPEKIDMAPDYVDCIICCSDGSRSEQVTKYMKNNGFNNMFYLEGGIEELFKVSPELKV